MNIIDVLSRRAQIEEELRNLKITMPAPDTVNTVKQAPIRPGVRNTSSSRPAAVTNDTANRKPATPVVAPPRPVMNDTASKNR